MVEYLNYEHLNIEEELNKIENCEVAEVVIQPNNKNCLFILGMLFANGVRIKILNETDLNLEETNNKKKQLILGIKYIKGEGIKILKKEDLNLEKPNKSFSIMSYIWGKIGNDNFPNADYSNVETKIDNKIENIKRMGIKLNKIENKPIENKIFLICPVRNATDAQKKWIEDFTSEKYNEGYTIHAPHLHTRQIDLFGGYAICKQNAEAIASSQEIDIYYDQSSTGSVFDLGVAYALHKPLKLLNQEEIIFDEFSLIDSIIKNWPYNEQKKVKVYK